jgi:hypothetical protein
MNVSYEFRTDKDFIWSIRGSYIPDFYWYPRLDAQVGKLFGNNYCVMINAGTGGFEPFFAGITLYAGFPICPQSVHPKTLSIMVASDHVTSLFLPNAMTGASARLGVMLSL